MSAGTGNFAYRVTRMIPESWAGIINFIFNRLVRWISPQQETNLKGFLSTNLSADADDGKETQSLEILFPDLSLRARVPMRLILSVREIQNYRVL